MLWYCVLSFGIGYVVGIIVHSYCCDGLYFAQKERGDYWYDKYMLAVRDDWEPLCDLSEADENL